jgi:hypothetical protein
MIERMKHIDIVCIGYIDDKEKELVEKTKLEHKNYCTFKEMTKETTKVLEELSFRIHSLPLMRVLKFCLFVTRFHSFSWIKVEDLGTSHHKKGNFFSKIEAQMVLNFQIFFHGLNHKVAKDFYT